jgi:hypothetical protein
LGVGAECLELEELRKEFGREINLLALKLGSITLRALILISK